MATMNVSLPADVLDFVEDEAAQGEYATSSEVIRDALRLLQHEKAAEQERLALLCREVSVGLDDMRAGRTTSKTAAEIAQEIRQEHAGEGGIPSLRQPSATFATY
ncbi:type II toxin-antitoxin system ParD family antitoxin [Pannonibacter indicus]|jgi:antitoxin ParD1/3/4|uniref:type II toxin-antitoxin system ParD family antitoxin n=1 Tax=Pannonibacter indicus TaxID=466044 RepID=UPI00391D487C